MAIDTATKPLYQVDSPSGRSWEWACPSRRSGSSGNRRAGAEQNAAILSFRPISDAAMHEVVI
jgi:hypothetical protein